MSVFDFLTTLQDAFDPVAADGATGVVQLQLSTPIVLVLTGDAVTLREGIAENPDVTLTADDDDLVAVMRGDINGVHAFLTGKLAVEGDLQLAKDIPSFFDRSKLT